jgi:ribosomal protein L9
MVQIADPSWKSNPDVVADETFRERYAVDYDIPDEREQPDDYEVEEPEAPEEPESMALIEVRQLPIIAERLRMVKDQVEAMAAEAASMVCTEETVQTVKARRAELRKQFDELEAQRKAVKAEIMAPYDEFEQTYKECISGPFKAADASLKATIDGFEGELKAACKAEIEEYFAELCAVHGIDFLTLDKALALGKIKINLSDARSKGQRKLRDDISAVVARVATDVDRITGMDDAPEVMAEYKQSFDVGHAVACVQGRKRLVESERERQEARRATQERKDAAVAKVEAVAPPVPVEPPRAKGKTFDEFSFTVFNVTRSQLIKIRDFLKQEGISYE